MKCSYACHSPEHVLSRRQFLAGTAGAVGMAGFAGMLTPAAASELRRQQKRVLLIWLAGGSSQLETWDPKPGTPTGGPFQAIPTSVPGTHICELLPHTAKQMHRMALVRGINTKETGSFTRAPMLALEKNNWERSIVSTPQRMSRAWEASPWANS